jgi:hypothetical protein
MRNPPITLSSVESENLISGIWAVDGTFQRSNVYCYNVVTWAGGPRSAEVT